MAIASCGDESSPDEAVWGSEATRFFDELSARYDENDFYGILDFYESTAFIEQWRGDVRGGLLIPNLLIWDSNNLRRQLGAVHLGSAGALNLVQWRDSGQYSAVVATIGNGRISRETVFDLSYSLQRSLRATEGTLSEYTDLYTSYEAAWTGGDPEAVQALYASDAMVVDALSGVVAVSHDSILDSASPGRIAARGVALLVDDDSSPVQALYLGPADYGVDPLRAVGIYETTDVDGCSHQMAVVWDIGDQVIVAEHRYHEVASFRRCLKDPPLGWWTGLGIPRPGDEVATGVIVSPEGREIEVRNGGPLLERALHDGMSRFAVVGLEEPQFDAVTFEPTRKCVDRSGRVIQSDGVRVLYVCLFENDICFAQPVCEEPRRHIRAIFAHELAHAWMIDHVDTSTEVRLLEFAGRTSWDDDALPWPDRGVEYGAETMAWGLLADPPPMVRIGNPSCEELSESFRILTGLEPPHGQC